MLEYTIRAYRGTPAIATAECDRAEWASVSLDVDPAGRSDAFNPAELLLTALATASSRASSALLRCSSSRFGVPRCESTGYVQDSPPRMVRVDYELAVDTQESDDRLALLHRNLQSSGPLQHAGRRDGIQRLY